MLMRMPPAGPSPTATSSIANLIEGDEAGIKTCTLQHRGATSPMVSSKARTACTALCACRPTMHRASE